MSTHLCISVRWIGDQFHGFIDGSEAIEWPPSPFRLFQALVAGAYQHGFDKTKSDAIGWIERQRFAPDILASPQPTIGTSFDHWVPDNDNALDHRRGSIRRFRPVLLEETPVVHYLWLIDPSDQPPMPALNDLVSTLGSLGWAIDQAYAVVTVQAAAQIDAVLSEGDRLSRFRPLGKTTSMISSLRVPKLGSVGDLQEVHAANCTVSQNQAERRRKKWPKVFDRFRYAGPDCPLERPYRIFRLVDPSGERFTYPHRKTIHIAGMLRHVAKVAMLKDPPPELPENWVETYIVGHADANSSSHRQLSYLPLPSVGHEHTDPGIRRVMIAAPIGDDALLDQIFRRLAGQELEPQFGNEFHDHPPVLVPMPRQTSDAVVRLYTAPASVWHSFTPVILPGHDDHKPEKTKALIARALKQSGIDQPCDFEWSAFSRFPKSYSAHKYNKQKEPQGFYRPSYLQSQTAVHLTLRFRNDVRVPGPIAIGAGRHCGLGLFATEQGS
jgi:CRISPR-associated protein Csb2